MDRRVTDNEFKLIMDIRKVFEQKGKGYHDAKVSKDRDGTYKVYDLEMKRVS